MTRMARGWRQAASWTCGAALALSVLTHSGVASAEPAGAAGADGRRVIRLTQTPCVIVEAEAPAPTYVSRGKEDCEVINARSLGERRLTTLRLPPGRYVFRVTNQNVPYELGFWLRGAGVGRLTLPSVSGGGLATGSTRDYDVTLVRGTYAYSCPLNPTPDYTLVVE
jgi:hypothetical protein